eukprot:COSAG02_NODE_2358_length_9064_cov_12.658003_6_plen_106_part_00
MHQLSTLKHRVKEVLEELQELQRRGVGGLGELQELQRRGVGGATRIAAQELMSRETQLREEGKEGEKSIAGGGKRGREEYSAQDQTKFQFDNPSPNQHVGLRCQY